MEQLLSPSRALLPFDQFVSVADELIEQVVNRTYKEPQRGLIQTLREQVIAKLRERAFRQHLVAVIRRLPYLKRENLLAGMCGFAEERGAAEGNVAWSRLDSARAILCGAGLVWHPDIPLAVRTALRQLDLLLAGGIGENEWLWMP